MDLLDIHLQKYSIRYQETETGYVLRTSSVVDRPSFEPGFFVEDYQYDNVGDLDHHNGRFCKTPDFPNGVYAYFAG